MGQAEVEEASARLDAAHRSAASGLRVEKVAGGYRLNALTDTAEVATSTDPMGALARWRGVPFVDVAGAGDVVLDLDFPITPQNVIVDGFGPRLYRLDGIGDHR